MLLAAWSTFEQAQKLFEAKESAYKEKRAALQHEVDVQEEKKQALLTSLVDHEELRKTYSVDLPAEWLEKYNRMRNVVPNPVVALVAGTCGGCSYMLTQQIIMALEQNKLIQCSGCYRLMYKNFDQTQDSAHSS